MRMSCCSALAGAAGAAGKGGGRGGGKRLLQQVRQQRQGLPPHQLVAVAQAGRQPRHVRIHQPCAAGPATAHAAPRPATMSGGHPGADTCPDLQSLDGTPLDALPMAACDVEKGKSVELSGSIRGKRAGGWRWRCAPVYVTHMSARATAMLLRTAGASAVRRWLVKCGTHALASASSARHSLPNAVQACACACGASTRPLHRSCSR